MVIDAFKLGGRGVLKWLRHTVITLDMRTRWLSVSGTGEQARSWQSTYAYFVRGAVQDDKMTPNVRAND